MTKVIGVVVDGSVEWHIPGALGDYATICGLDGNDPELGQTGVVTPKRGTKITCAQCWRIWDEMRNMHIRRSDFALDRAVDRPCPSGRP